MADVRGSAYYIRKLCLSVVSENAVQSQCEKGSDNQLLNGLSQTSKHFIQNSPPSPNFCNQKITSITLLPTPKSFTLYSFQINESTSDPEVWFTEKQREKENKKSKHGNLEGSFGIHSCMSVVGRAPGLDCSCFCWCYLANTCSIGFLQQDQFGKILELHAFSSCYLEGKFLLWKGTVFLRQKA